MKEISAALVRAQKAFGPALKTSTNPHFRSRYADLAACVDAVIDGLNNNGIMLMQNLHESSSGVIVETVFIHESGQTISAGRLHVPASKNDPQGYGSALTYARRYSLMAACGIAPEDDDGNDACKAAPSKATVPNKKYISSEQVTILKSLLEWSEYDEKGFCKLAKINAIDQLEETRFKKAVQMLEQNIKKANEQKAKQLGESNENNSNVL